MNVVELTIERSVPNIDLQVSSTTSDIFMDVHTMQDTIFMEIVSAGVSDYNLLAHKPQIEGVELRGNKTFPELNMDVLSVQDIEKILYLN